MPLTYNQEKAILEGTDKLYQICEVFGLGDEFVQDIQRSIDDAIKEQTGIDVNEN